MKTIYVFAMVLLMALASYQSASADCFNAYTVKAKHRSESIRKLKKAGLITAGALVGVTGVVVLPFFIIPATLGLGTNAIGLGITSFLFTTPMSIGLFSAANHIWYADHNQYFKALAALRGAAAGLISADLYESINRRIDLDSYSDERRLKTVNAILAKINASNQSELLCSVDNKGHVHVMKYTKFVDYILSP